MAQEESAAGAQQVAQRDARRKGEAGAGEGVSRSGVGEAGEVVCAREHEIRCRSAVVNLRRQCEELQLQLRCICVLNTTIYMSVSSYGGNARSFSSSSGACMRTHAACMRTHAACMRTHAACMRTHAR